MIVDLTNKPFISSDVNALKTAFRRMGRQGDTVDTFLKLLDEEAIADSGFIISVPERLIPDSSAHPVHTLNTNSCNILFTLALKSFSRLDFIFLRMSWLEKNRTGVV